MNICIIGPKGSKVSLQIKLRAEERGHICRRIKLSDTYFAIENNKFTAKHRKLELKDFDVFVFRTIANVDKEIASTLAQYLSSQGKKVLDPRLTKRSDTNLSYTYELVTNNLPVLETVITSGLKSSRDVLMDLAHPIIVKPDQSRKERFTVSYDWTDSYDIVRTESSKKFEFQQLAESDKFIRVYTIGNEVIGGLQKTITAHDNKLNYSDKFSNEVIEINNEISSLCKKINKVLDLTFTQIDLVEVDGEYKIAEVKRAPDFRLFTKLSGINYADKLIDYIEKL